MNRVRPWLGLCLAAVAGLAMVYRPAAKPVREPSLRTQPAPQFVDVATVFEALSDCRKSMPEKERWRIAGAIHAESLRYGYDPLFIAAMVEVESQCHPRARGPRGAVGLIQVKPATARAVAKESGIPWKGDAALDDAVVNLKFGVRYLWNLERRFADPSIAVAAYNLGPTRVARMPRSRAQGAKYVKRVLARYNDLLKQYS